MGHAGAPAARCRLYLAAPADLPVNFGQTLNAVFAANDIACLRVAAEPASGPLIALAQAKGCAVLLDGRPELVARLGADGVHLGDPAAYEPARRMLGPDFTIGMHCDSSRHLAMEAAEAGADYVAFGAFFLSGTKTVTTPAGLEILEWWSGLMEVPCVAIGGITVENCRPVIAAGADFLAVAGGVWTYKDGPQAAVRAFNALFAAG